MRLHTDREILRCIYDVYEKAYPHSGYPPPEGPLILIDVEAVADRLRCSRELLFGRLYDDLANRYQHVEEVRTSDTTRRTVTALFHRRDGDKQHYVRFPFLAAVLSGMDAEHHRNSRTWWLAVAAFAVSCASAAGSLWSVVHTTTHATAASAPCWMQQSNK